MTGRSSWENHEADLHEQVGRDSLAAVNSGNVGAQHRIALGKRPFAEVDSHHRGHKHSQNRAHTKQHPDRVLLFHNRTIPAAPTRDQPRCRLLELPAELREQIFAHAVTEWTDPIAEYDYALGRALPILHKKPIRNDRFNRPPSPAITRTCRQVRNESLQLYYEQNTFECWRPLFWTNDWSQSTFIDWLTALGPCKTNWLREVVLLYKHESELEYDVESALADESFDLANCTIINKQELSEYEMCFEELGLPRHFGKKRRWDRWMAGSAT